MTNYIPIEAILTAGRPSLYSITFYASKVTAWQQWLNRVYLWRRTLSSRDEDVWALFHTNSFEFSAILFALWSLEKTVCLPSNKQPALLAVIANDVEAFVGEFDEEYHAIGIETLYSVEQAQVCLPNLNTSKPLLQIYTSGSSGKPEKINKTIAQLSNEINTLHTLWGINNEQRQLLSTVSHQHIYGLLFTVLWPLAEGWCFSEHNLEHFEDISQHIQININTLLVSSPTHLSRIPEMLDNELIKGISTIFCSGAALSLDNSRNAERIFNNHVTEVYGSTETGGIAWKVQTSRTPAWQAMPGVQLRKNEQGCLEVRSPHLYDPDVWFSSSDLVEFKGNDTFTLQGRADRIVKVEGKRISLDEVETQLLHLNIVDNVRLILLEGHRTEIGAVIQLSTEAQKKLEQEGKLLFNQLLKNHLIQYVERPLLPRRWRYVDSLPVNSQGKLSQQMLINLFA